MTEADIKANRKKLFESLYGGEKLGDQIKAERKSARDTKKDNEEQIEAKKKVQVDVETVLGEDEFRGAEAGNVIDRGTIQALRTKSEEQKDPARQKGLDELVRNSEGKLVHPNELQISRVVK